MKDHTIAQVVAGTILGAAAAVLTYKVTGVTTQNP
jgi:membrane-associated phospholipid phosphatase